MKTNYPIATTAQKRIIPVLMPIESSKIPPKIGRSILGIE